MVVLILIYSSKCQTWKERSQGPVGFPYGKLENKTRGHLARGDTQDIGVALILPYFTQTALLQLICHPGSLPAFLSGYCLALEMFCSFFFSSKINFLFRKKKHKKTKSTTAFMLGRPQDYLGLKGMPARRSLSGVIPSLHKFSVLLIFYIQNIFGIVDLHLINTGTWKTKSFGLTRRRRKE